ncbi:MAG: hypothetical protein ACP5KI_03740 [Brevinematia bacterium]
MYRIIFLFVFIFSIFILSCGQVPTQNITYSTNTINVVNTNYTTNVITNITMFVTNSITNYITNYTYITNDIYTTNTNYVDFVNTLISFNLFNVSEDSIVQPIFKIEGAIDNISNNVSNFFLFITNNGYSNNATFVSASYFYIPFVASGYDKVFSYITLVSKQGDSYTIGLNLKVSNIPFIKMVFPTNNFVPTFSDITFQGYVEIVSPDTITNVSLIVSNSSGVFTNYASTNSSTSWTNVIERISFYSTPSLSGGYNYVKVRSVSSSGLATETSYITVLKSLFIVDGKYESLWNNAKLVGTTTGVNPYFGYGIGSMRVTNDGYFLYIFVSNLNVPNIGENGLKLSISIDTNSPSGLSNDAWVGSTQPGRFVYLPTNGNYPDIQIQMRLKNSNEINGAGIYVAYVISNSWSNIANTWTPGYDRGCMFGIDNTQGWEVAIPLSLIGIGNNTQLSFIAVLGQPDGNDNNSAIHVIPESPLNEITTNIGYFTNVIRVWSDKYTVSY